MMPLALPAGPLVHVSLLTSGPEPPDVFLILGSGCFASFSFVSLEVQMHKPLLACASFYFLLSSFPVLLRTSIIPLLGHHIALWRVYFLDSHSGL